MSLKAVDQLLDVLERARKEAPDLPLQQLQVLLVVASAEGATMIQVQERCSLTDGAGYRNIHALENNYRPDKEGRGWICFQTNPKDKRERLVYLTDKGRSVVQSVLLPIKRAK